MAKNKQEFDIWPRIEQKREIDKDDLVSHIKKIDSDFITVKEYASKYNLHPRTVQSWCANGRIEGAFKFGTEWAIPDQAPRPKDGRYKTGEWVGYRKREKKQGI